MFLSTFQKGRRERNIRTADIRPCLSVQWHALLSVSLSFLYFYPCYPPKRGYKQCCSHTHSLTHLEPLERGERLLVDVLDLVVGQVQALDGRRLLEDGLAEPPDAVAGEPEAVEGVEAGKGGRVHLADLVLAQVERPQRRPEAPQRRVRDVAEEVGVQAQVLQDGAAVLEDVPERKRWSEQ